MVACAIEAIAEAAALLRKYRMSAPDVLDVIILAVQRPGLSGLRPRIAHQQYVPPGFDLMLGMKDVGLALKADRAGGRAAAVRERAARCLHRRHRQRRRRQGLVGDRPRRRAQGRPRGRARRNTVSRHHPGASRSETVV